MTTPEALTEESRNGWVFYDGDCDFCVAIIRLFTSGFAGQGFAAVPLQEVWVKAALNLEDDVELLKEMRVLTRAGKVYGGAEAVLYLARLFWWLRPLTWLSVIPEVRWLLDQAYRFVVRQRRCSSHSCMRK